MPWAMASLICASLCRAWLSADSIFFRCEPGLGDLRHGNQFDVTTGQVVTGTLPVTAYVVQTRGDDVLIDLS